MRGNETRSPELRNVSKRCAASRLEIRIRFTPELIKFPCRDIFLELPIPSVLIALTNECDQLGKFLRRQPIHRSFDFSKAHVVRL